MSSAYPSGSDDVKSIGSPAGICTRISRLSGIFLIKLRDCFDRCEMAERTGLEPARPLKDWLFSRQLPLDRLDSAYLSRNLQMLAVSRHGSSSGRFCDSGFGVHWPGQHLSMNSGRCWWYRATGQLPTDFETAVLQTACRGSTYCIF
jgi:hypothetical protein